MSTQVRAIARGALWALPLWSALLFWGTLTHQPDPQTAFAEFARYVTTDLFLLNHILGSIGGAAVGSIGAIGLLMYLLDSRVAGRTVGGLFATVAANTALSAIFGVAAFAQPAMGRLFLAGQQNATDFYNQTYGGPLLITVLVALLLFIAGGVLIGNAVSASGRFPRWAGWAYAIGTVGFLLSNFIAPVGQSVFSALLFAATVVVAWKAGAAEQPQAARVTAP